MNRRGFLGSILALAVAPAIVRADSLMRVVPRELTLLTGEICTLEGASFYDLTADAKAIWAREIWRIARHESPFAKFVADCNARIATLSQAPILTPAPQALITQGARHV